MSIVCCKILGEFLSLALQLLHFQARQLRFSLPPTESSAVKRAWNGQAEVEGLQVAVRTASEHPCFWMGHLRGETLSDEIKNGNQTGGLERPAQRRGGDSSVTSRTLADYMLMQNLSCT